MSFLFSGVEACQYHEEIHEDVLGTRLLQIQSVGLGHIQKENP